VLVVGTVLRIYGRGRPKEQDAQEVHMAVHPTFVHAAADLCREALLAEAADVWRTAPASARMTGRRRGQPVRRMADHITGTMGRIIDDFEPIPSPHVRDPAWVRTITTVLQFK
jgi:hypothetical protein